MYKKIVILLTALLFISGCGGDKKEQKQERQNKTTTNEHKIKVIENAVEKNTIKEKSKANSGQFYYAYNKEKNITKDNNNRRTTLDAYLNIHSPYERVQITLMIKKLSRDFITKCSPCHDDYANGVIGPSLLGKDGKFIYDNIMAFKSGKKKNVLMKELVMQIDDKKLKAISDEIAEFNKQIQKMRKGR